MDESHIQALSWTVEQYDEHETPVKPADVVEQFESDIGTVRACFEDLEAKCLLARQADGYRPTVTARELLGLELDVDDCGLLVLDTDPCE